ncbi:glycosyl transferase [Bdellovibrio sp. qaytius]|nr:glycosyl transferase [Bdellovibrio sp. qaytius]
MKEWLIGATLTYFKFSIYYFFTVNTIYFILLVLAILSIKKQLRTRQLIESMKERFSVFAPSISVLAPAYNEEATISESIKSFMMLDYPKYEVIVINDGSKDQTLAKLKETFMLEPEEMFYDDLLSKTKIRGTYRSKLHPNLIVIDKENGGKADALNMGIGFSQMDVFCAVDSDSVLESDALLRIVVPFIEDPKRTIASGGTIRIANGSTIKHGRVIDAQLPEKYLPLMQVIEYTRAFLCGRIGWNVFNATLVVSGAFGLFSRDAVKKIGGYLEGSIGEDMELVVRIHRYYRLLKEPYRVVFVPDPVCWTEAPETVSVLQRQRNRWQRGLADTLMKNKDMFFNPKFGFLGFFAIPYYIFVELLGPVVEVFSYVALIVGFTFQFLDQETFMLFFIAGVLYGVIMSIASVILGEVYFSKYPKVTQFLSLIGISFIEAFGYRQMNMWWRIQGLIDYWQGKKAWGQMQRSGFNKPQPPQ